MIRNDDRSRGERRWRIFFIVYKLRLRCTTAFVLFRIGISSFQRGEIEDVCTMRDEGFFLSSKLFIYDIGYENAAFPSEQKLLRYNIRYKLSYPR